MIQWLKHKMIALALATSKIEKSALNNEGTLLSDGSASHQDSRKGFLSHDLINGIVSKEVENLRWRMYKVLDAANTKDALLISERYNEQTGEYETVAGSPKDSTAKLRKIVVDDYDNYKVILMVNNTEYAAGMAARMGGEVELEHKVEFEFNEVPKFKLEKFLKKINIRTIEGDKFLGELCFSKYSDGYNPTHALFLGELDRMFRTKVYNSMFDFKRVGFITHGDIGSIDNRGYLYEMIKFDKIVEFNGQYVVKFLFKAEYSNFNIFEKYRVDELDQKYENKERRNNII